MARLTGPLAEALERGREGFNARFAMARVDPDAFAEHLVHRVAPIVEAVPEDAVDPVTSALYDAALRTMEPASGWAALVPLARFVAADPRRVVASVLNAALRFGDAWVDGVLAAAPHCDALYDAGAVVGWRLGHPQYRTAGIAAYGRLSPAAQVAVLGEAGADLSERWRGGVGTREIGSWRGFGGEFALPPEVYGAYGEVYVTDGDTTWRLYADAYGTALVRVEAAPEGTSAREIAWEGAVVSTRPDRHRVFLAV